MVLSNAVWLLTGKHLHSKITGWAEGTRVGRGFSEWLKLRFKQLMGCLLKLDDVGGQTARLLRPQVQHSSKPSCFSRAITAKLNTGAFYSQLAAKGISNFKNLAILSRLSRIGCSGFLFPPDKGGGNVLSLDSPFQITDSKARKTLEFGFARVINVKLGANRPGSELTGLVALRRSI